MGSRIPNLCGWLNCLLLLAVSASVGAQTATPGPTPAGAPVAAAPRNEAGKIDLVAGVVTVVGADQKQRTPKKGEKLFEGDSVLTDAGGELHAEMGDGGVLAVRPNTAMLITKYQANGDVGDTSVFGLLKGSIRSITGWIGKANQANYKIVTPTVTIGVRGTDHEPLVIAAGSTEGEAGTYDRVHAGASFIEGSAGRVDVQQGRAGFVAAHGRDRPRVLDRVPGFYRAARNDQRLAGRHERIVQTHLQRRAARVKALQERRARADMQAKRQATAGQGEQRRQAIEERRMQQVKDREKRAQERRQGAQQRQQGAQQQKPATGQNRAERQESRREQRAEQHQQQQRQRPQARESHATPQQR